MDEDELENEVETVAPVIIAKKEPGVSHRIDDLPQGKADCFWCGRIFDINAMQSSRSHSTTVYVCRDCQP